MASAHVILKSIKTKIKGGCWSGRKVVPHDSKSDLPLESNVCLNHHPKYPAHPAGLAKDV